jgi:YhcH/YjgK/YiaL family protein
MVIDKITNLRRYEKLSPLFPKAFDYLQKTNFTSMANGKYAIEGDNVFAIVMEYQTKDIHDCMLEGHQKYIDVQFMIKGSEWIGITSLENQKPHIAYDADKDIVFFQDSFYQVKLATGNFTIFFPDDLHMPCVKDGEAATIKKVVLKIRS